MMNKPGAYKISARYIVLLAVFGFVMLLVLLRVGYLQVYLQDFLLKQGQVRIEREIKIKAHRGIIKDRNGEALAISTPVDSIWLNPKEVDLSDNKLVKLSKILKLSETELKKNIATAQQKNKEFLYVKRHVEPEVSEKVKALNLSGLNTKTEYRRFYPAGEVTAQLLGFNDLDDHGVEGLELAYDSWLSGKDGVKKVARDRMGRVVEQIANVRDLEPGKDVELSIDQRLQYIAYKAVKSAVEQHHARTGSAVVLDVHTGEVLAMVNSPSFNPNKRERSGNKAVYRNLAATDAYEPGSVLKTFSMASVLEHTKISPASLVDTKPGFLRLKGGVVRDVHNNGVLEVASILKESSNIGITKLVLNLKPRDLWNTYDRIGFGWGTQSGFPGENAGTLTLPNPEQSFVMATMSFGYGVTTTSLQLAQAYAMIGAGGVKYPVSYTKLQKAPEGARVLQPKVARQVLEMLSIAVEHSYSNARVEGYRVAGKTGTARKVEGSGYANKYRAVFGGLAPAINPRVAIVVMIDEPSAGEYYSNQVAAPVFAKIASGALRLLKIEPDLLDIHGVHVAQNDTIH